MPRYTKTELEYAIASSSNFSAALRKLKLCTTGGNHLTIKKYCSQACYASFNKNRFRPERRKTKRPSYERLQKEIEEMGFSATGRKYGVSDNAIRKWLRTYERNPDFK